MLARPVSFGISRKAIGPAALFIAVALPILPVRAFDAPFELNPSPVEGWILSDKTSLDVFIRPTAEHGDRNAQLALGELYLKGQGVPADSREAVKWFRRAADQFQPEAAYNLGAMSFNGIGVPQDYKAAASWLRKSARHGNREAEYGLAQLYLRGLGVERNPVLALAWIDAAIASLPSRGYADSRVKFQGVRSTIVSDLSPEQVNGASSLVSQDGPIIVATLRNKAEFERSITYPRGMRYLGRQGVVEIAALVSVDGHATSPIIERSSGYPQIDAAALKALPRAEVEPKQVNGQAVAAWQMISFNFALR